MADWILVRGDEHSPLFLAINKGGRIIARGIGDQAIYNMLGKRAKQAGVRDLACHDLRRSFISDLLDAGADISPVAKLAGHAQVQTSARYDRRGEVAKRKAVALLHLPYRRRGLSLSDSEIVDEARPLGDQMGTPERILDDHA